MRDALSNHRAYARRRVLEAAHETPLAQDVRAMLAREPGARGARWPCDDLLVPESMSLGYATSMWRELRDEERLALNHWLYLMHYHRITDGERSVILYNRAVASLVQTASPETSALLEVESQEEEDHIQAFGLVMERVRAHHGIGHLRMPVKPLRRVVVSAPMAQALTKRFGADYMVVYFVTRGLINHMGRGFERGVARTGSERNGELHALTARHALHESHHTSVSHQLSEVSPALLARPEVNHALYRALRDLLQRATIHLTFDEGLTKRQERAMSERALRHMPALKRRSDSFLSALIQEHFSTLSGVERAKNASIPKPNARLMSRAALSPQARDAWIRQMERGQGLLTFFPSPAPSDDATPEGAPSPQGEPHDDELALDRT